MLKLFIEATVCGSIADGKKHGAEELTKHSDATN